MRTRDKVLIAVLAVGILLRFYDLGKVPPGLYLDEVQYGLDAYSILKTGKDVYGHFLPLAFQSSGYYPPFFTYFLVPFIAIFGLSDWVVRLPSAIFGIASTILIYFLSKELIRDKKSMVPLIASAMISLLPLHIHFSRVAFLGSFGIFLIFLAIYLFLRSNGRGIYALASTILLGLASQVHYGYKLLSATIFLILVYIFIKKLRRDLLLTATVIIVLVLFLAINFIAYSKYNAHYRVNELTGNNLSGIGKQYLKAYSPNFLFISSNEYRLIDPWGEGFLPLAFLPLVIIGILRFNQLTIKGALILIAISSFTPIPSAFAGAGQQVVRNSPMLISLIIVASIGFETILRKSAKYPALKIVTIFLVSLFLAQIVLDLKFYFFEYPKIYAHFWGQKERAAVNYAKVKKNNYNFLAITDVYNVMLSFWAFENKTDPKKLQLSILMPDNSIAFPAKKLDNVYFLSTEQNVPSDAYKKIRPPVFVIDPQFYFKDQSFEKFVESNQVLFQHYENK